MMKKLFQTALLVTPLFGSFLFANPELPLDNPPPPKTEITPPVSPHVTSGVNVIANAEFLYLYAKMSKFFYGVNIAAEVRRVFPASQITAWLPKKTKTFDTHWDPGMRLGLGVEFAHDGWDLYSTWTYFYNSATASDSVPTLEFPFTFAGSLTPGTKALLSKWTFNSVDGERQLTKIKTKWSYQQNVFDLELGRQFWISHFLSLRPFFGLRGYNNHVRFDLKGISEMIENSPVDIVFVDIHPTQKFTQWGVGPLMGLNTAWYMAKEWSLVADISGALTYGNYETRRKNRIFESDFDASPTIDLYSWTNTQSDSVMQAIFDLYLGLRWERLFYGEKHKLSIDAGWEMHYWPGLVNLIYETESDINSIFRTDTDQYSLTVSGVKARIRYEF